MEKETPPKGEIVIYTSADGKISLDTKLENETIWLTQDPNPHQAACLRRKARPPNNISYRLSGQSKALPPQLPESETKREFSLS